MEITDVALKHVVASFNNVLFAGHHMCLTRNTHLLPRKSVAKKLPERSGKGVTTIIRGGDSASAVEEAGVADVMSDISTSSGTKIYPLALHVKDNGNHHLTHFSQPEFDQVGENARNHHRTHFRQRQSPPNPLLSAI
nr:phosphoglycerate kinase, chloroplastic [Tanacetum cinerariifolium]